MGTISPGLIGFAQAAHSPGQIKAAYLYNFTKHITWPDNEPFDAFVFGFYGKSTDIFTPFSTTTEQLSLRGKPVRAIRIDNLADAIGNIQVLVVSQRKNDKLEEIARQLRHTRILLISDNATDKRNTMINFTYPTKKRIAFEVNRSNIIFERLAINKKILLLGGTELDVAKIYKETEAELADKSETISVQQTELKNQAKKIIRQKDQIAKQDSILKQKEAELRKLEGGLEKIKNSLKQSETLLENNEGLLEKKEAELSVQQENIDRYAKKIVDNVNKLRSQKNRMEQQQKQIDLKNRLIQEKNAVLTEQGATIQNQRTQLLATFAALLMGVGLVVMIYYSGRQKHRANLLLKVKTEVLEKTMRELYHAKEELETLNAELRRANKAKSNFLSTMSHEIRTPMNGVIGMAELLSGTSLTDQQRHYLNTIESSGDLLLNVINDILDFSKIEADKMIIENIDFDIEKLIYECAEMFSMRDSSRILFKVEFSPRLKNMVRGDPTRVRQIIINLLSNAFKFTEFGSICLSAKDVGEDRFEIRVADTGVGMSESQIERVFESFAQADESTSRKYGGTGLGLSICSRLSELMGGEISLESELGQGSTFNVVLPLRKGSDQVKVESSIALSGKRVILLAYDNTEVSFYRDCAEFWGLEFSVVRSVNEIDRELDAQLVDTLIVTKPLEGVRWHSLILDVERVRDMLQRQHEQSPNIVFVKYPTDPTNPDPVENATLLTTPISPSRLRYALESFDYHEQKFNEGRSVDKNFSGTRILVAEDNEVSQLVIEGLLGKVGVKPVIANNGLEVLEHFCSVENLSDDERPFDLIFMDCEMPELDGFEATKQIRELERKHRRPPVIIVALTAHAMEEHKNKVIQVGMDECLTKPIKRDQLDKVLEQYCQ